MITVNATGHITGDAVIRDYNGAKVISFSMASNNKYKTAAGELKEDTIFIRCALWNASENTAALFFKGRIVAITGTLKVSVYPDHTKEDVKVNLDVRVNSFQVFGKGNQEAQARETAAIQPEKYGMKNDPTDELLNRITQETAVTDDLPF